MKKCIKTMSGCLKGGGGNNRSNDKKENASHRL